MLQVLEVKILAGCGSGWKGKQRVVGAFVSLTVVRFISVVEEMNRLQVANKSVWLQQSLSTELCLGSFIEM